MTGLTVLGVIILIIAGIMLIPIGADVRYEGGELAVSAKVCGILLKLIPKPPEDESKPKKPKKEKKPKRIKKKKLPPEGAEEKPKKKMKLSFNADEILTLVKKVLKRFGKFGRKFKVDRFLLRYTAAGDDPYDTAVNFGYVNAALAGLAPICAKRFRVKDCHVSTDVDFMAEKMSVDFGLALSIRIGQILGTVFSIVFAALGILIKNKLRLLKEKRQNRKNGKSEAESAQETAQTEEKAENTERIEENIQAEERMDSNG